MVSKLARMYRQKDRKQQRQKPKGVNKNDECKELQEDE